MTTFKVLLSNATSIKDKDVLFRIHGLSERAYTTSKIDWNQFIAIQRILSVKGLFTVTKAL